MNNEYKIIPFAEVKIGQEFDVDNSRFPFECHYVKTAETSCDNEGVGGNVHEMEPDFPCLVRIADCEPELEGCTWTYKEYAWESACGAEFVFTDEQDSLELNSFKFCHKCGCKIVEAK